jgi:hypothetical protein
MTDLLFVLTPLALTGLALEYPKAIMLLWDRMLTVFR